MTMRKGTLAISLCIVLTVVGYACTHDDLTTAPSASKKAPESVQSRIPAAAVPRSHSEGVSDARSLSAAHRKERARLALESVAWVGEIHAAAMKDLIDHRKDWLGSDRADSKRICSGFVNLILKYSNQIDSHATRHHTADEYQQRAREIVRTGRGSKTMCASAPGMSIFGSRELSLTSTEDPAWMPYFDELYNGLLASADTTPEGAQAIGAAVLDDADGLGYDDYQMVAAFVSLANSSAETWGNYASDHNCMGYDDAICRQYNDMSLFSGAWRNSSAMLWPHFSWKKCLLDDVLGGLEFAEGGPSFMLGGAIGASANGYLEELLK